MNLSQVKNQNPLITTIIPTFRRPETLKKAIQSVLNQTFTDFQVCVYDNNSQDATAETVEKLQQQDPRIKYMCHPKNIGAVANFQFGLDQVTTPFFSILSDDDLLLPNFFETVLEGFAKYPDAMFSCGEIIIIDQLGKIRHREMRGLTSSFFNPPDGLYVVIQNHMNWNGILFRREVVQKIGKLDPEIPIIDVDYLLRAAAKFPYVINTKPCGLFISHPASYSRNAGLKLFWPGYFKIRDKLLDAYSVKSEVRVKIDHLMKKRFVDWLFTIFSLAMEKKDFHEAKKIIDASEMIQGEKKLKKILMKFSFFLVSRLVLFQAAFLLVLKIKRFRLKEYLTSRDEKELKTLVKCYYKN